MNDFQPATANRNAVFHWIARLSSLVIDSVFLLILFLALSNEDKPQGAAIPVLMLLALTMILCLAAWRWERAGGIAVLVGGVCLGAAAFAASRTYGVGPSFLIPLLYAAPFLLVGTLFLLAARGHRSSGGRVETRP